MDSSSQKLGKADLILEELDLLAFLEQLGEAGVVGSVALNLIVKPDLDLKIGVDTYPTDSEEWSIDIWVTNDRSTTAFDFVQTLNKTLNQNQRLTILKIKTHFYNQGLLRDGLSLKIYKAVVEQGVKTVDEFLDLSNE